MGKKLTGMQKTGLETGIFRFFARKCTKKQRASFFVRPLLFFILNAYVKENLHCFSRKQILPPPHYAFFLLPRRFLPPAQTLILLRCRRMHSAASSTLQTITSQFPAFWKDTECIQRQHGHAPQGNIFRQINQRQAEHKANNCRQREAYTYIYSAAGNTLSALELKKYRPVMPQNHQ